MSVLYVKMLILARLPVGLLFRSVFMFILQNEGFKENSFYEHFSSIGLWTALILLSSVLTTDSVHLLVCVIISDDATSYYDF